MRAPNDRVKWVDAAAKLAAGFSAVAISYTAYEFQSQMSAATLLSQREQAETELRTTMFKDLITQIVGTRKGDNSAPAPSPGATATGRSVSDESAERERILVEMLVLNFHEHFEFKPLLEVVSERQNQAGKKELLSIVRRVRDRQIASLLNEGSEDDRTLICDLLAPERVSSATTECGRQAAPQAQESPSATQGPRFVSFLGMTSPDGAWRIDVHVYQRVELRGTTKVEALLTPTRPGKSLAVTPFTLSALDLPLTDNTLLPDGNRFAVVLAESTEAPTTASPEASEPQQTNLTRVALKLIWFPKSYIAARERPINYSAWRAKLGLQRQMTESTPPAGSGK